MTFAPRITALLLLLVATTITLQLVWGAGRAPDLVLATLLVFALFFTPLEMLLWAGVSVWLVNWQPAVSAELVLLAALPFLVSAGRRYIPGRGWAAVALVVVLGITLFYLITNVTSVWQHAEFFLLDLILSLLFGMSVFSLLSVSLRGRAPVALSS